MHNLETICEVAPPAQGKKAARLQILHVIGTLDPAWGGPVEGLRNLTTQALARGHNVEILCADDPSSAWLPSWNPTIHAVGPGRFRKYGFASGLDRWLADNAGRFDAIVVNGIWMYFGYAVWKATRRIGTPYFLFIHGALDPWFKQKYPLKHIKKSVYWRMFEHKMLRDAEKTLFTSQEELVLANDAFLPYKCRPEVTGYGIERPHFPDSFDRGRSIRAITDAHPALANRPFLLFLARIHEKKGIDLLLKAFVASKQALRGKALLIAGPAGDETIVPKLKSLASSLGISDDVVWTGPLYGKAKWEALRAAEAYVLPSHQENFGISVVEALACGTPVLVSDKVNIWREIDASNCGFVAPDDVDGTIRLLKSWAHLSEQGRSEMRLNARSCFDEHFDITRTSDRFFSLLAERRA